MRPDTTIFMIFKPLEAPFLRQNRGPERSRKAAIHAGRIVFLVSEGNSGSAVVKRLICISQVFLKNPPN
jgi:hypothetical protein